MSAFLRTDSTDTMGKWERALCTLHDIGRSSIARNTALQQDLESIKKNYETAVAELHYKQVAEGMHNTQIICAIDGSTFIFDQIFLRRGPAGARDAIKAFTQAVTDHLVALPTLRGENPMLWISIYLNRPLLTEELVSKGICTADQFDTFLTAFSMTSARFSIIDVTGDRKYIHDKLLAFCHTSLLLPTTLHVFVACQDPDVGFALATMGSHNLTFFEHTQNRWSVPSLPAAIVFMEDGLPSSSWSPPTPIGSVCTSGGLPSPLSPMSCYTPIHSCDPLLDPSLPLNKQNPPPCNEYYLMKTGCSKGSTCKYAHNYRLTEDQLALLAQSAKKAPCNNVKNGSRCPYGEDCCWGHTCPKGKDCPYKSKGKCWFKGDDLHVSDYCRG